MKTKKQKREEVLAKLENEWLELETTRAEIQRDSIIYISPTYRQSMIHQQIQNLRKKLQVSKKSASNFGFKYVMDSIDPNDNKDTAFDGVFPNEN